MHRGLSGRRNRPPGPWRMALCRIKRARRSRPPQPTRSGPRARRGRRHPTPGVGAGAPPGLCASWLPAPGARQGTGGNGVDRPTPASPLHATGVRAAGAPGRAGQPSTSPASGPNLRGVLPPLAEGPGLGLQARPPRPPASSDSALSRLPGIYGGPGERGNATVTVTVTVTLVINGQKSTNPHSSNATSEST